ncbi:MAG: sigma-70 family RNA polymerase sigma factor [Deltaproteobacteria bacterium]|nr:sigma-70 family RNA polymerase sigma factor [Deltaproteobacteria bacterium]
MAEPESNLRAVLAGVNWQELTKRLLLLTQEFVRERYLLGKSPGDLVQNAIRKLLEGRRKWNPRKVDLLSFLFAVIRKEAVSEVKEVPHSFAGATLEDQHRASRPEFQIDHGRQRRAILESLQDDPILCQIAEVAIDEELFERAAIAERLGITRTDFDNARKRLQRRQRALSERSEHLSL